MTATTGAKRFPRQSEATWKSGTALARPGFPKKFQIFIEISPERTQTRDARRARVLQIPHCPPLPKGDEGGFLNLFVELTNALNPHCSAHLHLLPSH
jgi:hypothetical protein